VKHLGRLVDDLLDVSRIMHGKIQLKRQLTELSSVVSRAIEAIGPLLEERGHKAVIEVPGEGMVISCDPDRLAQVMANLLDNAAKYSERGRHHHRLGWSRRRRRLYPHPRWGNRASCRRWSASSRLFRRKRVPSSVRAAGWALG